MQHHTKNIFKKLAQVIVYLLVFYFIGKIIYSNWDQITKSLESINYLWMLGGLVLIVLILIFQSFVWHRLLQHTQPQLKFRLSLVTYFKSVITRYIPGGIWSYFARTYLTSQLGYKKSQVLYLITLESFLIIFTGSLTALLLQPNTEYTSVLSILLVLLILIGGAFLVAPVYFIKLFQSIINKDLAIVPISQTKIAEVVFWNILLWLISGAWIFIVISAFTSISFGNIGTITGLYAVSWVIGFVILFMPSGFGVREIFLITLLGAMIGLPLAVVVSIIARLLFLIGEIICFLISLAIEKKYPSQTVGGHNTEN